mgnify:FL=1
MNENDLQRERIKVDDQDPFLIDLNFKCHYENPIATAKTPSIRQSQPHIYKRGPHSMDSDLGRMKTSLT